MSRPTLLALVVLHVPVTAQVPAVQTDASVVVHTVIDRGVTFAQPSFGAIPNAVAHQQDMVVEHAGWQYLAYWNPDRRVAVARRRLFSSLWETAVLPDYVLTDQDSHDAVNIGVCGRDGTIHLAFDHHVDTLHYRVSVPGLATDPSAFGWRSTLFGPIRSSLDPARGTVTRVTYPRFIASPSGGLQMAYREFTSGNGRTRLVDYDAATGAWSDDRVIVERTGSHSDPLGGSSSARNPYFNAMEYDDQEVLHATWTWRERAPTAYNRDIAYAYSPDGGVTWWNGAHVRIADTRRGQAITASSPGVNAVTLGAEWGLMNNQAQAIDRRGRVHVVMYHKDTPATTVSYGNQSNSHYNHFWKDADGTWRSSRLPTIGNRPKMFAASDGALFLVYLLNGTLKVDRATPEAEYLDWMTMRSFPGRFGTSAQGAARVTPHELFLTVGVQGRPGTAGASTNLGVVETAFVPAPPRPRSSIAPIADAYVRAGAYASSNFGANDRLIVKEDANADFDREVFLKFDVTALRGMPVHRVLLVAEMRVMGDEGRTTPYFAHPVVDDSWTEAGVTWNTRPGMGAGIAAHFGRRAMQWDVTADAQREALGDGVLSLGLRSGRQGGNRILHLHAREAAEWPRRPRLVVVH